MHESHERQQLAPVERLPEHRTTMSMPRCRRQDIPVQASWSLEVTERRCHLPAKCPTAPQPTEIPASPEMPRDLREDPLGRQVAWWRRATMHQANRDT